MSSFRAFRRALVAIALPLALSGCDQGSYTVEISFPDTATADAAATIDLLLLEACPSDAEVQSGTMPIEGVVQSLPLDRAQQPLPRLAPVGPGEYGLYARALGATCTVLASACVPVTLEEGGSATLSVPLAASAALAACAATDVCTNGRCIPTGDKIATRVGAGRAHSCALFDVGEIWCWGDNASGQLGQGDAAPHAAPVKVIGDHEWQKLSVGWDHSCAIDVEGRLYCWGRADDGRLGHAEGGTMAPAQVGARNDWAVISASARTTCGRAGENAYCWGANEVGQLGVGDTTPRPTPAEVVMNNFGQLPIAAGGDETTGHMAVLRYELVSFVVLPLGIRYDLYSAGAGLAGGDRATPDAVLENIDGSAQLSAGGRHTCFLSYSRAYCGGENAQRQLGRDDTAAPAQVGSEDDWTQISAGNRHTCGRRGTTLWCWGDNMSGQTGAADLMTVDPTQVGTLDGWTWVSAGVSHSCAIHGGLVYCWGANESNQSGLGVGVAPQTSPVDFVDFPAS